MLWSILKYFVIQVFLWQNHCRNTRHFCKTICVTFLSIRRICSTPKEAYKSLILWICWKCWKPGAYFLHLETERIRYKNSRYQLDFGKTRFAFLYGIACFCVDRIVSHCLMATIRDHKYSAVVFEETLWFKSTSHSIYFDISSWSFELKKHKPL